MISLNNITKVYGETSILNIPAFEFDTGNIYTIVGDNGAGKTTLLRLLNTLEEPTAGILKGVPEQNKMVLCFQKPYLFNTTVRQNIEYGLKARSDTACTEKATTIMEQLKITPLAEREARTLSSGEARKVSLARALVLTPELLLLDEPLANLDPDSRERAIKAVSNAQEQGATIIMCTHFLNEYTHLDQQVIRLSEGNLLPAG